VRVREQLDAAYASIAELAPELDRERDLRAALRDELEQARAELRTVTESRDQLHAWTQLELERLREQHEGLERVRRKEAADVERLSGTVRALRADMAHVVLQHRAAVDRLAAEVEAGLHELEAVASESCDHADVARRALESMGEPASSTVRDHLDVIATQVREVAGMAARLRRSVARARAVERRRTIREGS
jgi:DNA anti-recombination protein RmuC